MGRLMATAISSGLALTNRALTSISCTPHPCTSAISAPLIGTQFIPTGDLFCLTAGDRAILTVPKHQLVGCSGFPADLSVANFCSPFIYPTQWRGRSYGPA